MNKERRTRWGCCKVGTSYLLQQTEWVRDSFLRSLSANCSLFLNHNFVSLCQRNPQPLSRRFWKLAASFSFCIGPCPVFLTEKHMCISASSNDVKQGEKVSFTSFPLFGQVKAVQGTRKKKQLLWVFCWLQKEGLRPSFHKWNRYASRTWSKFLNCQR